MKKGRAGTMTHDYKRHGTTTLFAALNVLTGVVIGRCLPRHRNTEFLKFLRIIDREVPKGLQIHMICDNYGTHKHANVKKWLAKHPRFHLHFIPTSSSWLNLVERWFRELTDKAIRRGVFHSVNDLITAIEDYLKVNNDNPKPFVWTATAEQILTKVARGRVAFRVISGPLVRVRIVSRNGLQARPGAPYAPPEVDDYGNGEFNTRRYKAAVIQTDVVLNKLGWHFPQQRFLTLWEDVSPTFGGKRPPQPLFFRSDTNDTTRVLAHQPRPVVLRTRRLPGRARRPT